MEINRDALSNVSFTETDMIAALFSKTAEINIPTVKDMSHKNRGNHIQLHHAIKLSILHGLAMNHHWPQIVASASSPQCLLISGQLLFPDSIPVTRG